MIYIEKSTNNQLITTDNITNYIPTKLNIYLDDIYVGEFDNLSNNILFITFELSPLNVIDLIEKEYTLKIKSYGAILKEELSQVRDFSTPTIIQYNK